MVDFKVGVAVLHKHLFIRPNAVFLSLQIKRERPAAAECSGGGEFVALGRVIMLINR